MPPVSNIGNPAGQIAALIRDDLSATAGLGAFREAGGTMRTQTWYRLWGEVRTAVGRAEQLAGIDPTLRADPSLYTPWSAGRPGTFATQVTVYVRDVDTSLVSTVQYTHITDDMVTPDEAIQAALDTYTDALADGGAYEGQRVEGATLGGLYAMVGRPQ